MKVKFGIEMIRTENTTVKMFDSKEEAQNAGASEARALRKGECIRLFFANCTDEGKLATNELHVMNEWFGEE